MNEILKKRIEEAADKHSFKYLSQDRIEELELECHYNAGFIEGAEYALFHQWISVDEALPKNGENVFAIDSDDDAYVAWFDETDKTWQELSEGQFIMPTHWMPIPKFERIKKI